MNEKCMSETNIIEAASNLRVLLSGKAICAGFAEVLQTVLTRIEIKCNKVDGKSPDGNYVWNQVFLDGKWYNCDLTNDYDFICNSLYCRYYLKNDEDFSNYKKFELNADKIKPNEVQKCETSVSDQMQEKYLNEARGNIKKQQEERKMIQEITKKEPKNNKNIIKYQHFLKL